mmetsp:Transcript_56324/g.132007  ORF Transcript_56324/g.132007 Transcript_56324/m.132007 type:complete len:399 (-) Transcript_56324:47-1243(-)
MLDAPSFEGRGEEAAVQARLARQQQSAASYRLFLRAWFVVLSSLGAVAIFAILLARFFSFIVRSPWANTFLVIVTECLTAMLTLYIPWRCDAGRPQLAGTVPWTTIATSVVTTHIVGAVVLINQIFFMNEMALEELSLARGAGIIVCWSGIASSIILALCFGHYAINILSEDNERMLAQASKALEALEQELAQCHPRVLIVDDLAAVAPGECSICLEALAAAHAALQHSEGDASDDLGLLAEGLLRLPCQHVFHAICVRRWLEDRLTCPVCRCEISCTWSGCDHLCTHTPGVDMAASCASAWCAPCLSRASVDPRSTGSQIVPVVREDENAQEEAPQWLSSHEHAHLTFSDLIVGQTPDRYFEEIAGREGHRDLPAPMSSRQVNRQSSARALRISSSL